jgi:hypothetical protein
MPCSFHRAMIYLALCFVTVLIGRVSSYIVALAQSIDVARDVLLVMSGNGVMTKIGGTVMKPRASCG